MMDYVLYHNNCQDGWVAAFIAKMKYPKADLIPMHYGMTLREFDDLLQVVRGKDILMVDFSLPTREAMAELAQEVNSIRVFDHHISKKDILKDFHFAVFDNTRSGAGLTWDYLFGKDSISRSQIARNFKGESRPWWVDYTEDQDLWLWKKRYSREINSYLMVQERSLSRWTQIATITDEMSVFDQGLGACARSAFDVRELMRNVQEGRLLGYKVGVINTSITVSEVGEAIYNSGYDIAMAWHERVQGDISFGLRSTQVDVGAIAKSFGGGGHKAAAGFELSIEKGRELIDTVLGRKGEKGIYEHTSRCC